MDEALYLGTDGGERVVLDSGHLTTHAVCLGMTGSGKTGLGIVALEELARRGVPLLVIDLKGDMADLLLQFPGLAAEDFLPWLPPERAGDMEAARETAELWRKGLAGSGLGGEDIAAVASGVRWQLVTPGLAGGAPLDVLPSLSAPAGWDPVADPDAARDRVEGVSGALLSLVGRGGDPLTDRDMVLLGNVLMELWRRGERVDLPRLLGSLADPPLEQLGVLPLETVYPRKDRMELVLSLNTLLASPAFAAWTTGTPLDMNVLLGTADDPRATIVSLAHLEEQQRLFAMTLLFTELVAWMRAQPASGSLRALLYVDEVQGILPPYPANPPTKRPLLTLLKQGRAFGTGAWLATQNPVDLDYKALGNAGVKLVGRLITDRDRERALEGLGLSELEDGREADAVVAGLAKRQFLLYDVRAKRRVRVFGSRWAMSYLRGPVATAELDPLIERFGPAAAPRPAAATARTSPAEAPPSTRPPAGRDHPPVLDVDVTVRFAPSAGSAPAVPWVFVEDRVTVERRTLDLYRTIEERWRFPFDEDGRIRWEDGTVLEDDPGLLEQPPEGMTFPAALPPRLAREASRAAKSFATWRARQPVTVLVNRALKLVAEPGEDREAFLERCLQAADEADDASQERLRRRYQRKMETLKRRLAREQEELERDKRDLEARKAQESLGVVEGLMSVLLGRGGLRGAARRAASKTRSAAEKHRMRERAEAAVEESVSEIERIENELSQLAVDLEDEIDAIAAASEEKAARIEEVAVRPRRADVVVRETALVWG
ncbi:MAG TPA: DUF853 family protein [Acidobacteria bacterium]|nr:DUF853 family protein [Acidobacteriota bacterium]